MGLDMYFYKVNNVKCPHCGHEVFDDIELLENKDNITELCYFRKHSDLHGMLAEIWVSKNPEMKPDDFNCAYLQIDNDIVNRIEKECNKSEKNRKHYTGFFWGESNEYDWNETKYQLVPRIREEIAKGNRVYYFSWW